MEENERPRRVLFVTAELAPWSKVGGLGEVAAGLSRALVELDVDVRLLTPCYRGMRDEVGARVKIAEHIPLRFGGANRPFALSQTTLPESDVPVMLLEAPDFFELEADIYGKARGETGLGDLRWLYFAAALRAAVKESGFAPDVIHVNDWHTALAPALWRSEHYFDPEAARTAFVLTIHNAAFQGRMNTADYHRSGLRQDLLNDWHLLQDGELNLLKGGAVFSERVTTVSRRYAEEIRESDLGSGLEHVFEARAEELSGIPNGLDGAEWNPQTDPHIPAHFSRDDLAGKWVCRKALLEEFGLDDSRKPVLGMVARLSWQKGIDLVVDALPRLLDRRRDLAVVVLGKGDADLEETLREVAQKYPDQIGLRIDFDPRLAHLVEAGSDIFLMPSRYEPCGLNQMISQRYGTVPIVRKTGGLADTVVAYDGKNLDEATGLAFDEPTSEAFHDVARQALVLFRRGKSWRRLIRNAMALDWGWQPSAHEYLKVYEEAFAMRSRRDREDELLRHIRLEPDGVALSPHRPIPVYYEKDVLRLLVKDPRTIWTYWEVQGEHGRRVLDTLSSEQKHESRWEIRLEDAESGALRKIAVEGMAKNWFIEVEPRRRYRVELWMSAPGVAPILMGRSGEVETPPEIGVTS